MRIHRGLIKISGIVCIWSIFLTQNASAMNCFAQKTLDQEKLSPKISLSTASIQQIFVNYPEIGEVGNSGLLSRRSFLKGFAALAGVTILSGIIPNSLKAEETDIVASMSNDEFFKAANYLMNYYNDALAGKMKFLEPKQFKDTPAFVGKLGEKYNIPEKILPLVININQAVYSEIIELYKNKQINAFSSLNDAVETSINVLDDFALERGKSLRFNSIEDILTSSMAEKIQISISRGIIESIEDIKVRQFIKSIAQFDPKLSELVNEQISLVIGFYKEFFGFYVSQLTDSDIDKVLRAYIVNCQKGEVVFINYNSKIMWKLVAKNFGKGVISVDESDLQKLYARHAEIMGNTGKLKQVNDAVYSPINEINDLLISKYQMFLFLLQLPASPQSFNMFVYDVKTRNEYEVRGEKFSALRLDRIDGFEIDDPSDGGVLHGKYKDVILFEDKLLKTASRQYEEMNLLRGGRDPVLSKAKDVLRAKILESNNGHKMTENDFLEIYLEDVECHEVQHMINAKLGILDKLYQNEEIQVKNEESAYTAQMSFSRIPVMYLFNMYNNLINVQTKGSRLHQIGVNIFQGMINDYGVEKAGLGRYEVDALSELDVNTAQGVDLALRIIDWIERLSSDELHDLANTYHLRVALNQPHNELQLVKNSSFELKNAAIGAGIIKGIYRKSQTTVVLIEEAI